MTEKKWQTAEEFMAELQSDPTYRRQEAAREKKWQIRKGTDSKLEGQILAEFATHNIFGESIAEVVEVYAPLPPDAVAVLMRWLKLLSQEEFGAGADSIRFAESIVRALGAAESQFNGNALTECFDATTDEGLKWAIANTIALTHPHSIDKWLADKLGHKFWGKTFRELGVDQ